VADRRHITNSESTFFGYNSTAVYPICGKFCFKTQNPIIMTGERLRISNFGYSRWRTELRPARRSLVIWWYDMCSHLTGGISSLLQSVNLILFTLLLVHLIRRISPHQSHHLRSHHLSLPRPFTPDLKIISFTNPFLHNHSYSFRTAFVDLNLYCIKGALALFVLVSFSGYVC